MLNWLKRLFGGSDDSAASSPAEAAPAAETAPPPAETTAVDPTAPAEGATDPSADEPA
ncbi:MAG TPA: hypothetical protein VGH26_07600 [Gaiellaceae bacterium]|jgi:hypothetical protein